MKTKLLLFITILTYFSGPLYAQKENNVWIFGEKNGLDFNSGPPFLVTSSTSTDEGGASICDASGKLLFYSNGLKVWDNTHNVMPNGSGIAGSPTLSSTMGILFTQVPSDPNLYFLFTVDAYFNPPTRLRYSIIDKRLNGGKGDVVTGLKNIVVGTEGSFSEKMIVTSACGGLWLILHHKDSSIFYAYNLTNTTIPAAVKSTTPGIIASNHYAGGEMKASADFRHITLGSCTTTPFPLFEPKSRIEIFDFDTKTGIVSGGPIIDSLRDIYSVEFSPDGSKLYVGIFNSNMFQYDLSLLPSTSAVYASKYTLPGSNYITAQKAPDGKIYTVRNVSSTKISRINDPNKAGMACNVELDVASLVGTSGPFRSYGNQTAIPFVGDGSVITSRKDTFFCTDGSLSHKAISGRKKYLWNDGDTARNRTFSTAGLYWISSYNDCDQFVDTLNITIKPKNISHSSKDSTLCFTAEYVLSASAQYNNYLWNDGATTRQNTFKGSGLKWVTSSNDGCSIHIDSFRVNTIDFEPNLKDTSICQGEELALNAGIPMQASYRWQDGSDKPIITIKQPGKYEVELTVGPCKKKYPINIYNRPFEINLGVDTILCETNPLILKANIDNANYLWQDGSIGQNITVNESGIYSVLVSNGSCIASDSINVAFRKCSNCIKLPNAFSPNRDQKNDIFKAITSCQVKKFSMIIANRYGELIFQTSNPAEGWDGMVKGMEQQVGVYYYFVKVLFDFPEAKEEIYKGDVSMLR